MHDDQPAAAVIDEQPRPAEPPPPPPQPACTLPELFQRQAQLTPDTIAISHEGRTLTYHQLNTQANRLAHLLITRGAGPEQLIALCLPPMRAGTRAGSSKRWTWYGST
jgi:nonribosomal peptide synthetase DhbF